MVWGDESMLNHRGLSPVTTSHYYIDVIFSRKSAITDTTITRKILVHYLSILQSHTESSFPKEYSIWSF